MSQEPDTYTFEKNMKNFITEGLEYAEERHPGVKFDATIELDDTLTVRLTVYPHVKSEEVH